jgi:Ca2+-binding RTX toxin-like protein
VLATLAFAGSAPAGEEPEITVSDAPNGTLLVAGGDASSNLSTSYANETGPKSFDISVIPPGGDKMVETSTHCVPSEFFPDSIIECDYNIDRFVFKLGGGADEASYFSQSGEAWPSDVKLSVNGGPGDDTLRGGNGDDTIKGASGADRLLGKNGSDKLVAKDGAKDKAIDCGPSDDPKPRIDPEDPRPKSC